VVELVTGVLLPRSTWTSHGPIRPLTPIDPAQLRGLSVHWPGSPGRWGASPALQESCRRLEDERRQHTSPSASDPSKPWNDLAYSCAVDLAGRAFEGRGIAWRPAANGDAAVNQRWLAVTVLMGAGDPVTPAAVDGVRTVRDAVLARYPHAVEVVGHRDLHPTECPGPRLYDLIRAGAFTGPATHIQEADVPLTDDDIDRIAAATASRVWTVGWPAPTADDPKRVERAQDRLVWAARGSGLTGTLDTILGMLRGGVPVALTDETVAQLAAAIVQRLPAGQVDQHAVAAAVRAELAAALAT
jgi:hypothetical protein